MRSLIKKVFVLALALNFPLAFADSKKSAETLRREAFRQESVQDSIAYLKNHQDDAASQADLRAVLYLTGTLQEQLGLYTDAGKSYARAAGIAAGDAKNMPRVATEQIALDAARAALCSGDWEAAESYLNGAVKNSKDENISAMAKLYEVWSALCRASSVAETSDSIALLRAYSSMDSMKSVRAPVLFTLWYLTGDDSFSSALNRDFPASPENAVASGRAQIMSVPFWYFVPRGQVKPAAVSEEKPRGKRQQLGLFKAKQNADDLIGRLKAKGFDGYFFTEKRPSGTTYYIVVVDENESMTMGPKLRAAGFDCYTVE